MATTSIDICAQALVMIGAQPLTSFADGTTEATVAANLYEVTVRDHLARYRWRFATGQEQLSRLAEAPSTKWDAAYQIPATCLQPIAAFVNDEVIYFDRYEDMLFCNATSDDVVVLEAVYRVDEQFWPAWFVTLIELAMASHFALAIAAKPELSDFLDKKALRQAAIARNIDAQARTTPALDTSGIVAARRGRR